MDGFTNKCSFLFAGHMTGMVGFRELSWCSFLYCTLDIIDLCWYFNSVQSHQSRSTDYIVFPNSMFFFSEAHQGKVVELQGSSVSSSSGIGQCLVSMGSDKASVTNE